MRIAIIPARGGSKRIPRKNIKNFHGKPIISYTIEAALNSSLFDEVMVSTDDKEIAEIAKKYGARIPFFRSANTSNDTSTTLEVISEVLNNYEKNGIIINEFCCIYPCAPFISSELIKEAFQKFFSNKYDTVFPIVRYSTPIQRALKTTGSLVEMFDNRFQNTRSQDLPTAYYDAGMFYWSSKKSIDKNKKLFTKNTSFIELEELRTQDIDNEIDWKLAELKYELLQYT
jgi:pseudaminic acid cytidylyltransferase